MLNKKRIIVGSFATVIAAGAIGVGVTNADFNHKYQNNSVIEGRLKNDNFREIDRLSDDCPMMEDTSRNKEFSAIAMAHNLRKEGRHKQAREVLESAGIEYPGNNVEHKRNFTIKDAIEHRNWKEFKNRAEGKKIGSIINTKDKFRLLTEIHELHERDRHAEANEIMNELGLQHHHMR